jgi:hypothetical protein
MGCSPQNSFVRRIFFSLFARRSTKLCLGKKSCAAIKMVRRIIFQSEMRRTSWRMDLMNLDEAQRKQVAAWVAAGLKLSEIQNRLAAELGVRLTYMDVRLLVDDLKLTPKDIEPVRPATLAAPVASETPAAAAPKNPVAKKPGEPAAAAAGVGNVSVSVDQLARPGAVVSGKVTFSDGNKAEWYFDQSGRLGLVPQQTGYRPPTSDLQQFQAKLEAELSSMGF